MRGGTHVCEKTRNGAVWFKLIGGTFFLVFVFSLGIALCWSEKAQQQIEELDVTAYFENEEQYFEYIKQIKFDDVELHIVSIQRGDNYWKIAKSRGVDIDTLIGTNPHWTDLLARTQGRIVVPSRKGVLRFVMRFSDAQKIAAEHRVQQSEIRIQKMSLKDKFLRLFTKNNKPIAVYALGAKPRVEEMTASLAKQFELREMFRSPLGGRFSSFFGKRVHPILHYRAFHNGLDIAAKYGTPVGAPCDGVVLAAGWMGAYGKAVIMQHPKGFKTLCGHLSAIYVRPGQRVRAGRIIGRVGSTGFSTGPHLHFSLWKDGRPLDPMKVLW
ncbi:MAG: M23 family metallopeptidase [Spirochaetes bacterium]|nr:M23 family metallopeptidase [Spirochaetota bacterium]